MLGTKRKRKVVHTDGQCAGNKEKDTCVSPHRRSACWEQREGYRCESTQTVSILGTKRRSKVVHTNGQHVGNKEKDTGVSPHRP